MSDRDDARRRLREAYGGQYDEDVGDLAAYHDAATAFLATLDSHAPDEHPEDLDPQTQRRIKTAKTHLINSLSEIETAAVERIENE